LGRQPFQTPLPKHEATLALTITLNPKGSEPPSGQADNEGL